MQRSNKERHRPFRCIVGCLQLLTYQIRLRARVTWCIWVEDEPKVREIRINPIVRTFWTIGWATPSWLMSDGPPER